jgi:hypothetical protein
MVTAAEALAFGAASLRAPQAPRPVQQYVLPHAGHRAQRDETARAALLAPIRALEEGMGVRSNAALVEAHNSRAASSVHMEEGLRVRTNAALVEAYNLRAARSVHNGPNGADAPAPLAIIFIPLVIWLIVLTSYVAKIRIEMGLPPT